MATLTIRNLNEDIKNDLRIRAAQNGHSMEEEARLILKKELSATRGQTGLARRIHQRFAGSGANLELPKRAEKPRAPKL